MAQTPENRLNIVMYALQKGYVTGPNAVRVGDAYPPISDTLIVALGALGTVVDREDLTDGAERFDVVPHTLDSDERDEIIRTIVEVHSEQCGGVPGRVAMFKNHRDYELGKDIDSL